jgi:glycosyltransferase involved in cell wall biosynthesis
VRILMALPYGPSPTRVRSRMILTELARQHEITLVALKWDDKDASALEEFRPHLCGAIGVAHTKRDRARAMIGSPSRPLQQIASTSLRFANVVRRLIEEANIQGHPFDSVHVEHLRGASALMLTDRLGVRTVFDAVDCIAELANQARRYGPSPAVRIVARVEEHRTRRLETALVTAADATTVVAERDRVALIEGGAPATIEVIPNGVATRQSPVELTENRVAIFTGKLSYHANQAAVRRLLTEIWPRVHCMLPDARLVIAGSDPPSWLRAVSNSRGVVVVPDPAEIAPLIEDARVSLSPMVYSVGIQNKVLEAFARGVPVVATTSAADGLSTQVSQHMLLADNAADFADQTIRLLEDRWLATRLGSAGYHAVRRDYQWSTAASQFEALYAGNHREAKVA